MELKLSCPHVLTQADVDAGHATIAEVGTACGADLTVEAECEGGEWWGTDADGNRGMWIAPYIAADVGDVTCKLHALTPEEYAALQAQADAICENWAPAEPDYDGPDWEPDIEMEDFHSDG